LKKEHERFKAKAEELTLIFKPQCLDCLKNIDLHVCEEFKEKPKEYISNLKDCPKFIASII